MSKIRGNSTDRIESHKRTESSGKPLHPAKSTVKKLITLVIPKQYEKRLEEIKNVRSNSKPKSCRRASYQFLKIEPVINESKGKKKPKHNHSNSLQYETNPSCLVSCERQKTARKTEGKYSKNNSLNSPAEPADTTSVKAKTIVNDTSELKTFIAYPKMSLITPKHASPLSKSNEKPITPQLKQIKDLSSIENQSFFLTFSDKNEQTEEAFLEILTDRENLFNSKLHQVTIEFENKRKDLENEINRLKRENDRINSLLTQQKAQFEVKSKGSGLCSKCKAFTDFKQDLESKMDRLKEYLSNS